MTNISEKEIQEIVKRVVDQAVGGRNPTFLADNREQRTSPPAASAQAAGDDLSKSVAIGADHGGFEMKENLKGFLAEKGFRVIDCGTFDKNSVDYPDFAHAVAEKVSTGECWRGIMIDGAGIGSCMAANKVPGVRAAMSYDYATAVNSREHNDANVLTLGAGLIGINQAKLIVETWLATDFGGGRHGRRVDKIIALEKQYGKGGK